MISTTEMTETDVRTTINTYLAEAMGPEYRAGHARSREDGRWGFTVLCQRDDMSRTPAVGTLWADPTTGQIEVLNDEQVREMREAGAVQAAQARNELAKDENGYILRRYARIQANVWISDRVGLKIKASGGTFVPSDPPVWRFSIFYHTLGPLAVMDVSAKTAEIDPLTDAQLQAIREDVRAIKQLQPLAATA
ncbi:hypothetical protein KFU94_01430 [Chloroflexi bacterium TSY]|nr:hypothetical protein [Chloroflexi bacterium TSY]